MTVGRILLALVALVVLTGCSDNGTGDKGYVAGSGVTEVNKADRKPVGSIRGDTLQGEAVSLKQLAHGRPAVINVWASWCGPCRGEATDLNAAAKQLGGRAAFLGISIRSASRDNAKAFERTYHSTYPSLWDPDGQSLLGLPRTATRTIPTTIVIDSQGRVSATIFGPLPSTRTLVELVKSAG